MGSVRASAALVALLCTLAAAGGTWCRATFGAQVTADEPQYLLTALSIAEDGDLDIADEIRAERWRTFHEAGLNPQTRPLAGGREISPHDPLLPLLLALPMGFGGWVATKLTLALFAGLLGAAVVCVAVRRFGVRPGVAAVVAVVLGASIPLASYGNQVYPEVVAALCVVLAVGALTGPMARGGRWALGACVVALPWLSVKYAPVAAVLALLGLLRLPRRAAVGLAAGLAAAGVVFVAVHLAVYGGLTPYASADHFVGRGEFAVVGFAPNYLGRSQRLAGLLVDREFGIAAWQPAWLFAVAALGALARVRPPGWAAVVAPVAAGYLNATFVALTAQGFWVPGRQIVVVLGLVAIALAWWLERARALWAFALVGLAGIVSYAWLVFESSTGRLTLIVNFWETANPLYRAWSLALPDYLVPTAWTWPLHGLWTTVLLGLVAVGWRLGWRAHAQPTAAPDRLATHAPEPL